MKLAFYGDSWYWVWFPAIQNALTNSELSKMKGISVGSKEFKETFINGYDILTPLLTSWGHQVENYCRPGNSFRNIVLDVLHQPTNSDFHVVYVSTVIRDTDLEEFLNKPWNQVKVEYDEMMYQELQRLGDFALKNKQKILLFGGQTTLKAKQLQNAFEPNDPRLNYLYLGAECIITEIHNKLNITDPIRTPGIFKLAQWANKQTLDTYDASTIHHLHEQIQYYQSDVFMKWKWPDSGHLNFNGQIHFLNLLFDKIQQYKYVI